ncbi:MAG: tRNA pseudouridine(38-40) synthase TruA [Erysipelotrichaceae bacterium]|nr:tRNA pseudouridine(38-40) synthase TruA [Erysipelotrichaceae bacterium]MDY5251479.1 tRNA pseudouridine(38-40) synthase TruA [Erysipelotrichaceae bacterium]
MIRYKCTLMYDGTNYNGFQTQVNGSSIQEEVEKVLTKICDQPIKIVASGRTDAKVHAYGHVFHFDTDKELSIYKFKYAINGLLPKDIQVCDMEVVDELFHARYCVASKQYDYLINNGHYDVFKRNYSCYEKYPLDIELMQEASKIFIGEHDFTSFNASPLTEFPNQVRYIEKILLEKQDDMIKISFIGEGFLRYMVRMLSACLIEVGKKRLTVADLKGMMEAKDKKAVRYNAPAQGLYLQNITYFKMYHDGNNFIIRDSVAKDGANLQGLKIIASRQDNKAIGYIDKDIHWLVQDDDCLAEWREITAAKTL